MIDVIVNPIAGDRTGKKVADKMKTVSRRFEEKKCEYTLHRIDEDKRTREYTASLIAKGATTIVAMGGDGTLHEVLNGITEFDKIKLGLIPCGTGNDFAKNTGIPTDLEKAVDLIVDGEAKPTDYIQFSGGLRGMNVSGTGIDVEVLRRYQKLKKKTKFGYTKCLIRTLLSFSPSSFTAEFNGKSQHFDALIAAVCNGSYFGGGLEICPTACCGDGKLEFVCVKNVAKLDIPSAFIKLKKGKILEVPSTFTESVNKIKITGDRPLVVQIDGEIYEDLPFELEIVSDKLKMIR